MDTLEVEQAAENALKGALIGSSSLIAKSPLALPVAQMLLMGNKLHTILEFMTKNGFPVSGIKVISRYKMDLKHIPLNVKKLVLGIPTELRADKPTTVDRIKETLEFIERRIDAIHADEAEKPDEFTKDKELQLMKYYDRQVEFRKKLETEMMESEVVQAEKRTIIEVAKIALTFILEAEARNEFIQKIGKYEKRNL